jgi:tyrosyl-tRNA synthetase
MNVYEDLQWRELIADCTDPNIVVTGGVAPPTDPSLWHRQGITLYAGFDPTADSLHVGSLVPLLALRRFQLAGHHPIALAGGATGSIGDPSGKSTERQLLTKEVLDGNIASVRLQLAKLLDFDTKQNPACLVDNASWTAGVPYLDFLRDIGKHFSVNQMVAKESVRARMEDREVGISYTEFSYMLLQAFDFYVLARDHNCELQIGGSDQWGNITAGIDLCRKKLGKTVYGLTLPLITNADGTKFGKTEAGAIWLDPKRTSVYRFYQFWINTADADVIRYLKYFTFLSREEVVALEAKHAENPGAREAHRRLAVEVTSMIHGDDATVETVEASNILFGLGQQSDNADYNLEKILQQAAKKSLAHVLFENTIVGEVPTKEIEKSKLDGSGMLLVDLLVHSGLCPSKGQARKDIEGGGVNINNVREPSTTRTVTTNDLLFGKHVLLRKGKKNYVVVTAK